MKRGSLLLVDDDRLILDSMSEWLREQGYDTATAPSREQALRQLQERTFELVLADIRLADGDGFDVLAYCRQHCPQTTVILMTGTRRSKRELRPCGPAHLTS